MDIFKDFDIVLIPVHLGVHWTLAVSVPTYECVCGLQCMFVWSINIPNVYSKVFISHTNTNSFV